MQQTLTQQPPQGGKPGDFIRRTLDRVQVGPHTTHENLTVFPLFGDAACSPDYLTLGEALDAGIAQVTEVSQGGSVPELSVVNTADRPVLILDGEELHGAKQNRVVNLSILVPAHATLSIPVSCVEMGRWYYTSPEFSASMSALYAAGRARKTDQVSKSMRLGRRHADQGDVWEGIALQAQKMSVQSPTSAIADVYARYSKPLDGYVEAFTPSDDQVGALFAVGSRISGFDLFDSAKTLRTYLGKLVRSHALDTLNENEREGESPSMRGAEWLLEATAHSAVETYPALGLGVDVRLREAGVIGAGLLWQDRVVHLHAFTDTTAHRAPRRRRARRPEDQRAD